MVNGLRVILTTGGVQVPVRAHSKRRNQGKPSYHARIAKKWLKRFGTKWFETQPRGEFLIIANQSIMVRNEDWPLLQKALADE